MDKLFSKILTVITVPSFGNGSFLSRKIRLLFLCCFLLPSIVFSVDFPPERSASDADNEIGWLVAPLPIVVEGIGVGVPIAASISNVYKNTDLLMAKTFFKGDFEVSLFSISKFPLIKEKLLFSLGLTDFYMPFRSYDRGIDSGEEDYYQTLEKYNSNFVTFQSQYFKQRLEFLLRYSAGGTKVEKIFDVDGNEFSNVQSPERSWIDYEIGTQLDLTDNHLDPSEGLRIGLLQTNSNYEQNHLSDYAVNDLNITAYFPFFETHTLLFNAFQSRSNITTSGLVDENSLRNKYGLSCELAEQTDACNTVETRRINYWLKRNQSSKATALGGLNRMRAYSQGRFYAANSSNYVLEYRLNYSEKRTPINWIFLGGLRTVLQTSFFYETGSVSDEVSLLHEKMKSSFGVGFRAIISGLIYRFDLAKGEDGIAPTLFINYPLSIGSLGN
jgi:hypothetical protein